MDVLTSVDSIVLVLAIMLITVGTSALLQKYVQNGSKFPGLPLPPGPKGLPIIGNVLDMPEGRLWEWAAEQSKKYGDLIYVNNFGHPMLFVNSYQDATELLDKRSSNYSSRARLIFARELQGWDWYPAFMPYGEEFRKHRAILHRITQPSVLPDYVPLMLEEVQVMLKGLLANSQNYYLHIRRFPGSVILMIIYGHKVTSESDPLMELSEKAVQTAADAETVYMVEFFPWLKYVPEWIPGAEFKKRAREGYPFARALLNVPYEEAKSQFMDGTGRPCVISRLIQENMDKDGNIVDEDVIKASAGILFAGGQDTITTTIMTALLALTLNPEIQIKAQEEIDRIVGQVALPTLHDRESLPYLNAIMLEAMRWNVVTPLGVPHASMEEDEYKGYRIPAGTVVLANAWAMSKSMMYSNPEQFNPERWLHPEKNHPEDQAVPPMEYAFGFGRRICPGNHYAMNAVFLAVASILAVFKIEKKRDKNGLVVEPKAEYSETFTRNLKPFECTWTPRSSKAVDLVQ